VASHLRRIAISREPARAVGTNVWWGQTRSFDVNVFFRASATARQGYWTDPSLKAIQTKTRSWFESKPRQAIHTNTPMKTVKASEKHAPDKARDWSVAPPTWRVEIKPRRSPRRCCLLHATFRHIGKKKEGGANGVTCYRCNTHEPAGIGIPATQEKSGGWGRCCRLERLSFFVCINSVLQGCAPTRSIRPFLVKHRHMCTQRRVVHSAQCGPAALIKPPLRFGSLYEKSVLTSCRE